MALTFTKYEPNGSKYLFNELDVIIGGNMLITTIGRESKSFNKIFEEIEKEAS
ncbi:MAG: hypothetical protein WCL02_06385 [bacterium]